MLYSRIADGAANHIADCACGRSKGAASGCGAMQLCRHRKMLAQVSPTTRKGAGSEREYNGVHQCAETRIQLLVSMSLGARASTQTRNRKRAVREHKDVS